ncbi:bifunctional adenosylcobinamide kinase/adenosylcobinamide-phosphate guanylyltransferase [Ramlibacter sp. MAHUQ-53]|uniref:bifunctional adenosylcobinamide kinase/adenosylcobinamide-phosphate guanylyltransferase n=1 Tax=unclassified Ramlibacter TaxID=2617605 RepID=UPI003643E44E
MRELRIARSELILGGDAGGKLARAQALADAWLGQGAGHRVVYIATAQAWDADMRDLVDRHRREGGERSRMVTVEEPTELAHALGTQSRADTLIVVDCLTLWLTASLMQALLPDESDAAQAQAHAPATRAPTLADAVRACAGPLVLVSHQLDAAALPARKDSEAFLETLGALNQQAARACERVTLMAGGDALTLKEAE